jgi:hypothetical protein
MEEDKEKHISMKRKAIYKQQLEKTRINKEKNRTNANHSLQAYISE